MATPPVTDRTAPPPAVKGDPAREKRLAEALRANLRRRKAAAAPAEPKDDPR
jgi:hypothetical protein